ncbi:MAG TPA: hypothetical protein VD971_01605 [Phycisphaerales bacterium]|nr:hypothetical protein [Phycisphaerales bacterium]
MHTRSIVLFLLASAAVVPTASATVVVVNGDAADYHIALPEGNLPPTASAGIGGSARLGTFRETRNPPVGRADAERRAIFQFDLASLQPFGNTVANATFSVYLPAQASGIPTHDLDLWASSDNRASAINFSDAGAIAEFDAPSYTLVFPTLIPRPTPPDLDRRYSGDITAFLQARYNDFLANPAERYVFFRTQVEPSGAAVNSFYELNAAEAGGTVMPLLTVDVVPAPATGALALAATLLAARRRR